MRECEEILQIENVQWLHVHDGYVRVLYGERGLPTHTNTHTNREQEEAAQGTLRILKVPVSKEQIEMHEHVYTEHASMCVYKQTHFNGIMYRFRHFTTEVVDGRTMMRLCFLAIDDCQLPLIPGLPCLRTAPLSFLLPMQQEGHYAAFMFPKYALSMKLFCLLILTLHSPP